MCTQLLACCSVWWWILQIPWLLSTAVWLLSCATPFLQSKLFHISTFSFDLHTHELIRVPDFTADACKWNLRWSCLFVCVFQVLCNGPGTCIPLCAAGLLLGILGLKRVLLVYVESICRVESLSLSGKILYHFADYFFVQWKPLQVKYPKSVYIGRIVWNENLTWQNIIIFVLRMVQWRILGQIYVLFNVAFYIDCVDNYRCCYWNLRF